jgi:HlyD family secretion protein
MSVLNFRTRETERPQSGSGMDRIVERKGLDRRIKLGLAALGIVALGILFYMLMPAANSQTVPASRLTISTAQRGRFDDFLPLRARVEPSLTVYLDAVEGGRVERVLVEDGAMVQRGQLLAVLSNPELQLNVLARQTEVTQQLNNMRSQELSLHQTRLANERARIEADLATDTARRQYEMMQPLARRGFVSGRAFADARDTYEANRRRSEVIHRQQQVDERLQSDQLQQLRASATSLTSSLEIARASLDALNLRARSTSRSASRSSAASGSARSTARATTSSEPTSTNSILAGSRSGRSRPPRSAAVRCGCASPKSIRRSATACSRSTCASLTASRPTSSGARPCRSG